MVMKYVRSRGKSLGLIELVAIAIGGMVGGGIFSILGISVSIIGYLTPLAIILGGLLAMLAGYSYVKLGLYYRDEGATYAFIKRTYPQSHRAAASIGWFTVFGYISTLALYAYTFSSYVISGTEWAENEWVRKAVAWGIIGVFTLINLWSVKGMGRIEDLMVYTKMLILAVISVLLMTHGHTDFGNFMEMMARDARQAHILNILIVASITFVAYEGFQLVINAVNEMKNPEKNIPHAIYTAIITVMLIYVILALGALFALNIDDIVRDKEYALAAGAQKVIGKLGYLLVVFGAVLATSSAISGTVFGSSRQMARIADDGYLPAWLTKRRNHIPVNAIITMSILASVLILIGGLQLILEFGSITFLLVSLLVAAANYKIRDKTGSSPWMTLLAVGGLTLGGILILYYEFTHKPAQMWFILGIYVLLSIGAISYARLREKEK